VRPRAQSALVVRPLNYTVRPHVDKRRYVVALPVLISLGGCIEITTYTSPAASGTVIDTVTKRPIPGATVSVDGHPGLFAQTNSEGQFVLVPTTSKTHIFWLAPYRSLPPRGTIVVFADGYAATEVTVDGIADQLFVSLGRTR
jgi:hypothetical protein